MLHNMLQFSCAKTHITQPKTHFQLSLIDDNKSEFFERSSKKNIICSIIYGKDLSCISITHINFITIEIVIAFHGGHDINT